MAATPLEYASLGYKLLELSWEIGKSVRNSSVGWWKNAPYRLISSLTTLEFAQDSSGIQLAHYVQDRSIIFMRPDSRLPAFQYGTEGQDIIEDLVVDGQSREFIIDKASSGIGLFVRPRAELIYRKGDSVRAVLLANSKNGFPKKSENFEVSTRNLTDSATLVIVFEAGRKPSSTEMLYQGPRDQANYWRPTTREKHELRRTTRGRFAFTWEARSPRVGNRYLVKWEW
jgi:hypothetical protein